MKVGLGKCSSLVVPSALDFRRTIRMQSTRDVTFGAALIMANDDLDAVILRAGARLGYTAIRPNQHKAVKSFIEGSDVYQPSDWDGKWFCYSVLPFVFDGLCQRVGSIVIVVSSLIVLMKDQVRRLHTAEPRAVC